MGVFVALLIIPLLIQHVTMGEVYINFKRRNYIAILFFFIFLTFLIMFRHESVGNDTANYIYFFNKLSIIDWASVVKYPLEIGYSCYNKLISLFIQNSQVFLCVTAILTSVMIYPTYKRLCIDPTLTITLFCTMSTFVMLFSGIRQMLAIGLGFVAYEFTRNKKLLPFLIIVALAITFHLSAFMLFFMYPLYHIKITKNHLMVLVPILITIFVFNKQIFSVLSFIIERYTNYDATITKTNSYTMIILFVLFVIFAFLVPEEQNIDKETRGLRNFLIFALALQMFAPLHTVAMRMNYYYIIFIPLLMPKIISLRSERWKQVAVVGRHTMIVFFMLYFFFNAKYGGGNLHVFPYHFFWENI